MREIIQYNMLGFIICLYIILFVFSDIRASGGIYKTFLKTSLSILCLIILDCFDMAYSSPGHSVAIHTLITSLKEFMKVLSMYCFLLLSMNEKPQKSPHSKLLFLIPLAVTAVLIVISLFSGIVFSYSDENVFIGGPLRYISSIVSIFYLCFVFYFGIVHGLDGSQNVSSVFLLAPPILVISMLIERTSLTYGFFATSVAVCTEFAYIVIHGNHNSRDQLTDCFNRRKFYLDARHSSLSAVITFDMNGLKILNDTEGHAAGDEAIITIANNVSAVLPSQQTALYRMGGDEFSILCHRMEEKEVEILVNKIKNSLFGTPYSIACGYAMYNHRAGLDATCHTADIKMYKDKQAMKATRT